MKKIIGYLNTWGIAPGETLLAKVSTYGPEKYQADLVRVICGNDNPDHGLYKEEKIAAPFNGEHPVNSIASKPSFSRSVRRVSA